MATGVAASDYQLMVDSIADAEVIMLGRDGTILTWNHGAARLKGCTADEAIGKNVSMFYQPEDAEAGLMQRELSIALETGRFEGEGWRVRKDGSRFWANVVLSPMRNAEGEH